MLGVHERARRMETTEINFLGEEPRVTDIKEIITTKRTVCNMWKNFLISNSEAALPI
jgi:hypothetical protein